MFIMKKIAIIIIALVVSMGFYACNNDNTDVEKVIETEEPTANPTATAEVEPEATLEKEPESTEEVDIHEDYIYISDFLDDGLIVFMEDSMDMDENKSAEFGGLSKTEMGSDGYEFTFEPNMDEHLSLLKHLDEFDGATSLGNQGIYVRFKTTTIGIYFTFLGENDFGIYFGNEGQPLVFTYTENQPFSFDGDFNIEVNKWHNMFMAMDKDGNFNCIFYEDNGEDGAVFAAVALGETSSGEGYKNQSWQFEVATHEEGTITIEHYDVYSYGSYR